MHQNNRRDSRTRPTANKAMFGLGGSHENSAIRNRGPV